MKLKKFIKTEYLHLVTHHDYYDSLCSSEFKNRLDNFLQRWEEIRKTEKNYSPILDSEFPDLPFSKSVQHNFEWKWRQYSLSSIETELKEQRNLCVLEVGGWNGWLSNRISQMQNEVLSVDIFSDDLDGLSSKKKYKNSWHCLQCDTEKLNFLNPVFDLIIVNHAVQFFQEPVNYCNQIKSLLKPGGRLILLGLNFYFDTKEKEKKVDSFKKHFKSKYDFSVFFNPSKAYLSFNVMQELISSGFEIFPQKELLLRNIYSRLNRKKPYYCWAKYQN